MAINKDLYDIRSFLKNATFNRFYLDVNSLPVFANISGDYVIVPPECDNRIDLFSYQQYGSSRLWWVIALANADLIDDPIWDFRSGMTLLVPKNTALLDNLVGGN